MESLSARLVSSFSSIVQVGYLYETGFVLRNIVEKSFARPDDARQRVKIISLT